MSTETLGLYATWLELPVERLYVLNRLSRRHPLAVGTTLRLDFSHVSEAVFRQRRLRYHRRLEENFFQANTVNGILTHTIKRGETLWLLARRKYDVPLWLLQRYNAALDVSSLTPGTKLRIPQVMARAPFS